MNILNKATPSLAAFCLPTSLTAFLSVTEANTLLKLLVLEHLTCYCHQYLAVASCEAQWYPQRSFR